MAFPVRPALVNQPAKLYPARVGSVGGLAITDPVVVLEELTAVPPLEL